MLRLQPQNTELGESPCESVTVKLWKEAKSDTWEHAALLPEPEVCRIKGQLLSWNSVYFRVYTVFLRSFVMKKEYSYFSHCNCEYFPCHEGANPDNFNCLFCYCPLYVLGDRCGGNFTYLPNGNKDCSRCLYPHLRENYDEITGRYKEIMAAVSDPQREKNV